MVIAYFGTPAFAVPTLRRLLASGHVVRGVVTQPDRPRGRGQKVLASPVKALAVEHAVPVFQPPTLRDPAVFETLADWRCDLGVVAAYGQILPEALLQLPAHGMINVHASLLPKYRGAAPVHRAIVAGEIETGVTIMQMVKALDAGDMLASVRRPIGPDETSEAVERDLAELGADLLLEVIDRIEAGTARPEPQDHARSTYAPRLTKDEGRIDWTQPAGAIHNRVRGLQPWPLASTFLDGERIILRQTRVLPAPGSGEPGEIVEAAGDALHVATGGGGRLAVEQLQTEGRRPMGARDFLAGRRLAPGAQFA